MKLARFENAWAQSILGAIFPGSRDAGFAAIGRMDVRGFLGQIMGSVPLKAQFGLRVAVWVIALSPLFVVRRFATLRGIEPEERERVVSALSASRWYLLRSLVMMMKTFGAMLYAGDNRIRERLGVVAPAALQAAPPSRGAAPSLVPLRIKGIHVA